MSPEWEGFKFAGVSASGRFYYTTPDGVTLMTGTKAWDKKIKELNDAKAKLQDNT